MSSSCFPPNPFSFFSVFPSILFFPNSTIQHTKITFFFVCLVRSRLLDIMNDGSTLSCDRPGQTYWVIYVYNEYQTQFANISKIRKYHVRK